MGTQRRNEQERQYQFNLRTGTAGSENNISGRRRRKRASMTQAVESDSKQAGAAQENRDRPALSQAQLHEEAGGNAGSAVSSPGSVTLNMSSSRKGFRSM